MRGRGALSGLALLALGAPDVARADGPAPFRGAAPVVTVEMVTSHTARSETLDVFTLGGGPAPRYGARRIDLVDSRPVRTRWADSRSCPALVPQLKAIATLQVRFASPTEPRGLVVLDGTYVTVRTAVRAVGADAFGDMTLSGNFGPWVDWASATDKALEPCWSGTEPALTTGG